MTPGNAEPDVGRDTSISCVEGAVWKDFGRARTEETSPHLKAKPRAFHPVLRNFLEHSNDLQSECDMSAYL